MTGTRLPIFLLFLAVLAVYTPHLDNGFIFDDHQQIASSPVVRGDAPWTDAFSRGTWAHIDGESGRYYRPLFTLVHRLVYQAGEGAPWAFHLFNLGLHLLVIPLVVTALRRLGFAPLPALAATAVFALHPLAGEVVYWASCTSELLVQMALLLVLIATLAAQHVGRPRRFLCQAGAASALLVGLLAKETALIIAPLLTLEVLRHPRPERLRRLFTIAPLWVVTAGYLVIRARVVSSGFGELLPDGLANVGQFGAALAWYAGTFIFPFPLTPFHSFPLTPSSLQVAGGLVFLCLLTAALLSLLRFRPGGVFWMGWVVLPLLLPLVPLLFTYRQATGPIAERYMFISLVPWCALTVRFAGCLLAKAMAEGARRITGTALCLLACIAGGVTVFRYGDVFRDDTTYFRHAFAHHPQSPFVLQWLAVLEIRQNRFHSALSFLDRAQQSDPGMLSLLMNRAFVLTRLQRLPEAVQAYRLAIQRHPAQPGVHFGLANVLQDLGEIEEASEHYREELRIQPDNLAAMGNLGICLYQMNDQAGALDVWNRALALRELPDIRFNLAMAYRNMGQGELAKQHLRKFLLVADESHAEQRRLAFGWLGE